MSTPRVAIFMAVHNGASWLPTVLQSALQQTYPSCSVTVWDNSSSDDTRSIVEQYPAARYEYHDQNIGFWAAQEQLFSTCDAEYILSLTDVVLDPNYVQHIVEVLERDSTIGAAQGKLYQMTWHNGTPQRSSIIDGLGFRVERSRRVTILGHGAQDRDAWNAITPIIAVEGAAPLFRRSALEACRIEGHFADGDYRMGSVSYGDDIDMGWRMTLFGWHQVMIPTALGWHDRSTTKGTAETVAGHFKRVAIRRTIPLEKRRLDWSNVRFTIIKNDYIMSIFGDLPWIIAREVAVQAYTLLFEPRVLMEWGRFFRLLPRMIRRRKAIMRRARISRAALHEFFR